MTFDPDQEAVLADPHERLLIEAPPGSGKTRTAVTLIGRDIDQGGVGGTQRVLVLTFSRNARAQLDGYAAELLTPDQRVRAEITNYHSWFWGKVSQYRCSLGLPLDLELATEAQRNADVAAAMQAAVVARAPRDRRQVSDYSRSLEYELPGGRPDRLSEPRPRNAEVAEQLRELHIRSSRIHYDDLAYYTWLLLSGSRTLHQLWRHKYPVIVLDEYQDTSPLQAAIVNKLAGNSSRVYAFADPLQQIYEWRDASKRRLDEFREQHPSEHRLRTLHRYRDRPALQTWMQQVRDVLLDDAAVVRADRPPEVQVTRYDPAQPERSKVWGAEARELWQLDDPIARAFRDAHVQTIAVLTRRREQLSVLERHLTKNFRCGRLRARDDGLDFAVEWVDGYATAVTIEHHAQRLLRLAQAVVPRHPHLDLHERVGANGIDTARLREPRRTLAEGMTRLAEGCESVADSFRAAQDLIRLACHQQDRRAIDWDTLYAVRHVLQAPAHLPDDEAGERARARVRQARFRSAPAPRRGLYLLSCHEGKGKEFDFVILPHVSTANFKDDEESRQLLYVSLSRARQRILIRLAQGDAPAICQRLGLG
ncbi:MAG: UvrD-helicase domain-containing protein [Solirubrobacteraceae bacterium]